MLRSPRIRRPIAAAAVTVALFGIASAAANVTYSAFSATRGSTQNSVGSGTVAISDNDSGSAMLSLSAAALGSADTSCIRATSTGSLDSELHHYAVVTGALAPYLTLKVTRGSGAAGFDDCTGFAADATNYVGAGPGVLFDGQLSSYPTSYASGLVDPATSGGSSYTGAVSVTSGLHSHWRLGESSGTSAADAAGTNTGTYYNGVTLGVPGALGGDANTAAQFDGLDDYVSVTRQIQDDFSIEFWFKSTQGLNTGDDWWANAGLVDAEVAGLGNDFGVTLRSDGKITAGVGSPDVSIVTPGSYNNGTWHHVVFTRTRSTGRIDLYADGASAGTATGHTGSLTQPATLAFGRLQAGWYNFAGSLDEVAVYDTALSSATVTTHYAALVAPEVWTTSESHDYKFAVTLGNDSAALGKSAAATFRWEARNR